MLDAAPTDPGRVSATRFVVIGAGGLGCPAILGLIAAGARNVVVLDDDRVEPSNLHRQVLYRHADRARRKSVVAREFAERRGATGVSGCAIRSSPEHLERLLGERADPTVVLECTDSADHKFAVNDLCVAHGVPAVLGGVLGWQGQITAVSPATPCFRCLFEASPPPGRAPTCGTAGVIGSAAGTMGYWMTLLALRLASGHPVDPTFRSIDFRNARITEMNPRRRPDCPACQRAASVD